MLCLAPRQSIFTNHIPQILDTSSLIMITSNKNIHFEMILDVGIGEKRKETRFLI